MAYRGGVSPLTQVVSPFRLLIRKFSAAGFSVSGVCLPTVVIAILLLAGLPSLTNAQQLYDGNQNLPPFGSFGGSDFDIVSLQNGNLHITVPLLSVKQRGKDLAFKFIYDTPAYTKVWIPQPIQNHPKNGTWVFNRGADYSGWRLSTPFGWSLTSPGAMETCGSQQFTIYKAFVVQDPEGAKHQVPLLRGNAGVNTTCGDILSGPALDGSGIWATATGPFSGVITLKDGTVINAQLEDSNGNLATASSDTIGRNLLTVTNATSITYTSPLGKTVIGPASTQWIFQDSNGAAQQYQLTYQLIDTEAYSANLGTDHGVQLIAGTVLVPATLTLPNLLTYTFVFVENSVGQMQSVTLPAGGSISYTYQSGGSPQPPSLVCQVPLNSGPNPTGDCRAEISQRTVLEPQSGTSATWSYNGGVVKDPYGNEDVHTFQNLIIGSRSSSSKVETEVQRYSGCAPVDPACGPAGTLQRSTVTGYTGEPDGQFGILVNVRPISVTTTLDNGLVSQTQTDYETFLYNATLTATRLNPTSQREYDYGSGAPGSLLRQTKYTYLHTGNSSYIARNIVDRILSKTVLDVSNNQIAQTTNEYDNYGHSVNGQNLSMQASNAVQHDAAFNTSNTIRGNVTAVSHWRNTDGVLLTTINQYDDAGNVISSLDPLLNKTSFDFTDSWSNATCAPSGQGKAYVTKVTNALSEIMTKTYDSCTGALASATDPNLQPTTYAYDLMRRPTSVSYPDGGGTSYCYADVGGTACTQSGPPYQVVMNKQITGSSKQTSTILFDGLGRTSQTQLNSDPGGVDYVDTTYDLIGRKSTVSNPHRTASSTTDGITIYVYDVLGRPCVVGQPDGATVSQTSGCPTAAPRGDVFTQYTGNCTSVTDETGNSRQSCVDGLGRLTQMFEDPGASPHLNYETDYVYDALDNLTSVTQKGSSSPSARTRTFTYNSLSQILCAANPEIQVVTCPTSATGTFPAGAILYTYDADGNLLTKKSPKPNQTSASLSVTATNTYDQLNRLTKTSYDDGSTPTAQFGYDAVALTGCATTPPGETDNYPIGRHTTMCDGSGAASWGHDKMGRVSQERRAIGSAGAKYVDYTYNVNGSLAVLTTPPLKQINYTYDKAEHAISAVDATDSINFVTGATYAPAGELSGATLGAATGFAGFTLNSAYNTRLQPMLLSASSPTAAVFSECFDFHLGVAVNTTTCSFSASTLGNNGNVYQVVNNRTSTRSQSFTYDVLNRIASGQSSGSQWGESYTLDAWGNMTAIGSTAGKPHESLSTSVVGTSNQLAGFGYDAAGNMTSNGLAQYVYDAENRLIWNNGTPASRYIYDGNGQRVEKCAAATSTTACPTSGTSGTLYFRGTGSDTLDETDLSGNTVEEYIFFNGQRIARRDVSSTGATIAMHYYFSDHLGSHGVVENATGTACEQDIDYYPYGGVQQDNCGTPAPQNYKFTGKERDGESGLDYFIHRHYASTMGRFMQPDPAGMMAVDIGSPQTLNRYSYVLNNPLSFTDPFGLDCAYLNSSGTGVEKGGIDQHSSSGECGKTGGYWVEGSVTNVSIGGDAETVSLTGTTNGTTNNTSASYQQNATWDVGEFHNTMANPFNHTALGLHGGTLFGQNPRSDAQFSWKIFAHNPGNVVVPGEIKPQVGGQLLNMVHIPVTGMQAQMMQDAMSQSQQNPPPYSLGDHGGRVCDCASWAQQILGDAGINSGPVTRSPDVLMQQLKQEQSPNQ